MHKEGTGVPRFAGVYFSERRKCLLSIDATEIKLRPKSLSVFRCLSGQPNTVINKESIADAVWGDIIVTDDSLTKCISDIRRALRDDDHVVLRTIPRQGYMLVADEPVVNSDIESSIPANATVRLAKTITPQNSLFLRMSGLVRSYRWLLVILISSLIGLGVRNYSNHPNSELDLASTVIPSRLTATEVASIDPSKNQINQVLPDKSGNAMPSISISGSESGSLDQNEVLAAVSSELRIALGQYRTIKLIDVAPTNYVLKVTAHLTDDSATKIYIELIHTATKSVLMGHSFDSEEQSSWASIARRTAGMVASPSGGAIGRHLLITSINTPANDLTRAECFSHGYDCTNCSGELDSITPKAEACLTRYLAEDPNDAQAWALQSTLYAHQYTFGSTLSEPQRSQLAARSHLPNKAIQAATRAEQLSDGGDSSVYWGLAQAYSASCQVDKLRAAAQRGLELSPNDPGLLAAFGNWIAYTGHWDEGVRLVERALEQEPRFYKKWWLFGPAKRHYSRGEYQLAYDLFARAFNERNWLSHLQFAYTLPHLNRLEEARQSLTKLQGLAPGITLERVLEFYKTYCFPNSFLSDIKKALIMAGMPSRGNSDDLDAITVPHAQILSIDNHKVEYMDLGQGIPVIFVHGAISDYRTWAHYQNPVSEKYRYLSYSRRYFGSQDWPDEGDNKSRDVASADLIAFIDALKIESAFLVTWSSGGPIGNLAAASRPDLFKGMIHYEPVDDDVFSDEESDNLSKARNKFYSGFDRVDAYLERQDYENSIKAFLETVFELKPGGFENEIMPLRRVLLDSVKSEKLSSKPSTPNTCEFLKEIRTPTVVVRGDKTNRYWSEMSGKFAACMPNADLVTLPGVNHDGPIRDHAALYAVIDKFIQENR